MVMIRQKLITALIGLICFSLINGSFTVICHGSDGHQAIEPVLHNHCECPESDAGDQHGDGHSSVSFVSTDHYHCKDVPASSIFSSLLRKDNKSRIELIPAKVLSQNETSGYLSSRFRHTLSQNIDLDSFFTPLQSVILLA